MSNKFISLVKYFLPQGYKKNKYMACLLAAMLFIVIFFTFNLDGIVLEAKNLTAENTRFLKLAANVVYYIGTITITTVTLFFCFTSKYKLFRTIFWILTLFAFFDITYRYLADTYITVHEFVFLFSERQLIVDATVNYLKYIAISTAIFILIMFLSEKYIPRYIHNSLPKTILASLLIISFVLPYFSLQLSNGRRERYVAQFRIPAVIAYSLINADSPNVGMSLRIGKRETPVQTPGESLADIVIMIVDESIVAYALGINGSRFDNTPLLANTLGGQYVNLGIASSSGNGSAASNYILRNNIKLSQLPDIEQKTLTQPSLFSYAQKAGYKTYFIDAQAQTDALQNFMSKFDMENIDVYFPVKVSDKMYTKDFNTNEYLEKEIKESREKKFFFIVKQGLHFPYNARYPREYAKYTPDFAPDEVTSYASSDADRLVNTFANAIIWNVDHYFEDILDKLSPHSDRLAIIYTSDHGESVGHKTNTRPHNTLVDPPMAEAAVPLILAGDIFTSRSDRFSKDCYSHFQIGPTIMKIFGYGQPAEETLFDGCPRERKIYTGAPFTHTSHKYDFYHDDAALLTWQ